MGNCRLDYKLHIINYKLITYYQLKKRPLQNGGKCGIIRERGGAPMSTANRKYKDSVFVDLFSEDEKAKENFLSLYNALHGTALKDTEQLKTVRLDQVLYMAFYNDVSYLVDNKIIVLAEHQSTINPNMPLRCLE